MAERTFVIGVGMTDFVKPSARPDWDYPDMVRDAGTQALDDAGVRYEQIEYVAVGYCFCDPHAGPRALEDPGGGYEQIEYGAVGYCWGDTTAGQRAVYELGHTGVPVMNV